MSRIYVVTTAAALILTGCATHPAGDIQVSTSELFFEAPDDPNFYAKTFEGEGEGDPTNDAAGIWSSEGYGIILDLSNDNPPTQYLHSAAGCFRETLTIEDISDLFHLYLRGDTSKEIYFADGVGGTLYQFDKITALPIDCSSNVTGSLEANLEAFIGYLDTFYPSFAVRQINWPALKKQARQSLANDQSERGLFQALSLIITILDDNHTEIIEAMIENEELGVSAGRGPTLNALDQGFALSGAHTPRAREIEWMQSFRANVAESLLHANGVRDARGQIDWGWVEDDVGYIQILTFGDYAKEGGLAETIQVAHRVMNEALVSLSNARAIIVDVSQNRGGYDLLARAIAGHFATKRKIVYKSRPKTADAHEWQSFSVDPIDLTTYHGDVYLLTSDITVSAAEIFTLSMRALPNVRHVGISTRGALSVELARTLPNSWVFGASTEIYIDHENKWYEGRGIPPSEIINVFDLNNLFGESHIDTVRGLAARIQHEGE